jgi:hypothetical protein
MRLATAFACTSAYAVPDRLGTFSDRLDAEWIEEALLATGTATVRRRRLPAEQVVWLVLGMAMMRERPIVDVVRDLDLVLPAAGRRTVAPSAVAQARARLGPAPLEWLFLRSASEWAHRSADAHRWRGLALYGVDGTTLRVPDSDENRAQFGGQPAGGLRGDSGYPLVRLAALMALRSHLLAAASFGPYIDERHYAADLWTYIPDDSLTIVDRNFLAANVLLPLQLGGKNRHWMTRAKSTTKWRVIEELGPGDSIVELDVHHHNRAIDPSLPRTFRARALEYQLDGHPPQRLLTSLLDAAAYPAKELVVLYHERWEMELAYDEIKTEVLEREEAIRSKSPQTVMQEIWGVLLAYNLIRLEMEQIADDTGVSPIRISFVAALRFIRREWEWSAITRSPGAIPRHLEDLRDRIRQFVLPPRHRERSYPRAVKLKMSNYARNRRKRPK